MGYIKDYIVAKKFPDISDSFWRYSTWKRQTIMLPRQDAFTKEWHNRTHLLRGTYSYIMPSGKNGMVFVTEKRWLTEESFIILKLKGKIVD